MYYRYNDSYLIYEKSTKKLSGENVCTSDIDFDIELYNIYIALLSEDNKIKYHTQLTRPIQELTQIIKCLREQVNPIINIEACTLEELKTWQINESKTNLEIFFNTYKLKSSVNGNDKFYSITIEKQAFLTQMIIMAKIAEQAGIPYQPIWNEAGEIGTIDWTVLKLQQLAFEMELVIRPMVIRQQEIEDEIKSCETKESILAIDINFIKVI